MKNKEMDDLFLKIQSSRGNIKIAEYELNLHERRYKELVDLDLRS